MNYYSNICSAKMVCFVMAHGGDGAGGGG